MKISNTYRHTELLHWFKEEQFSNRGEFTDTLEGIEGRGCA
jgi:hypothetical protein